MQRQVVEHRTTMMKTLLGRQCLWRYANLSNHVQIPQWFCGKVDKLIRFYLAQPIIFLYICWVFTYWCSFTPKVQIAIAGAIAFGFSTYLLIILGLATIPKLLRWVYASGRIWWCFPKAKTRLCPSCLGNGLQLHANHYQMTYYLLISWV